MNDCKVLLSLPLDFIPTNSEERKTLCKIYPPKVGEVLTNNNLSYIGLLTMSQEDIDYTQEIQKQKTDSIISNLGLLENKFNTSFTQEKLFAKLTNGYTI
jgi:hypothetical protein